MGIILKVFLKKEVKIDQTKIDPADLDSPRREFSNGGLGIVITLSVRWQNIIFRASTGGPIQLYLSLIFLRSFLQRQMDQCICPKLVSRDKENFIHELLVIGICSEIAPATKF